MIAFTATLMLIVLSGCNGHDHIPWTPVQYCEVVERQFTPRDEAAYYERSQASARITAGIYVGTNFMVGGGLFTLSMLFYWLNRRKAKLEENLQPDAPLRDGVSVVFGHVEAEDGAAVSLRIVQRGREQHVKGGWRHAWDEIGPLAMVIDSVRFTSVAEDGIMPLNAGVFELCHSYLQGQRRFATRPDSQ